MNKEDKYKQYGELFCDDCKEDETIKCPRDKDVKCLSDNCGKELCAFHMKKHQHCVFICKKCGEVYNTKDMEKHLKDKHQIDCKWKGI